MQLPSPLPNSEGIMDRFYHLRTTLSSPHGKPSITSWNHILITPSVSGYCANLPLPLNHFFTWVRDTKLFSFLTGHFSTSFSIISSHLTSKLTYLSLCSQSLFFPHFPSHLSLPAWNTMFQVPISPYPSPYLQSWFVPWTHASKLLLNISTGCLIGDWHAAHIAKLVIPLCRLQPTSPPPVSSPKWQSHFTRQETQESPWNPFFFSHMKTNPSANLAGNTSTVCPVSGKLPSPLPPSS